MQRAGRPAGARQGDVQALAGELALDRRAVELAAARRDDLFDA
jgi:hypothetical protein